MRKAVARSIARLIAVVFFIYLPFIYLPFTAGTFAKSLSAGLRQELSKYQSDTQSILFFQKYGITQFRRSPQALYGLFARVEKGAQPVMNLFDARSGKISVLGGGTAIAFDPAVNDRGDYAFALLTSSVSESRLFVNHAEVGSRKGLYKSLFLTSKELLAHYYVAKEDKNYIYSYNLKGKVESYLEVDFYVESFGSKKGGNTLVQGVSVASFRNRIFQYDPVANRIHPYPAGDGLCYFGFSYDGGVDRFSCFAEAARAERLHFLLNRQLLSWDPAVALACSNNELGRLSWHVAYRMAAMAKFSRQLDSDYPLKRVMEGAVECLLSSAKTGQGANFGWPASKYSFKPGQPLSLLANNAIVVDAMLGAAQAGMVSPAQTQNIVGLAESLFERHESDYLGADRGYRFSKGISFWADGIVMPFNQQNILGSVLLKLFDLTGEDKYKQRAGQLASFFRRFWVIGGSDGVMWHYWPEEFYRGWSPNDALSSNTPSRDATEDTVFEDTSHAGLNIEFVVEFRRRFGDDPFSTADIEALGRTLRKLRIGDAYSFFLSGDATVYPVSTRWIPVLGGWLSLADDRLLTQIASGLPAVLPRFEGDPFAAYLAALDRIAPKRQSDAVSFTPANDGSPQ